MMTEVFACATGEQASVYRAMHCTDGGDVRTVTRTPWTPNGPGEPEEFSIRMPGPGAESARADHGLLRLKRLDIVVIENLAQAFGTASLDLEPDPSDPDGLFGVWPADLVDALADADEAELRSAGERWMEIWCADLATVPAWGGEVPEGMEPRLDGERGWWKALADLAGLARRTRERSWTMYAWFSA